MECDSSAETAKESEEKKQKIQKKSADESSAGVNMVYDHASEICVASIHKSLNKRTASRPSYGRRRRNGKRHAHIFLQKAG